MKKPSKRLVLVAALVVVVAVVALRHGSSSSKKSNLYLWAPAERGRLSITLEENGEIKPSEQLTLKSEVEGRVNILSIVPEGSLVKKGDTLVTLDVTDKETEKVNQEITVTNAESELTTKTEDLEIARNQAKTDIEDAELELRFAKEDLQKYIEGEYPNELTEQKGELALSEAELVQAEEKYEWSKKLFDENFLSESELKSDELSWRHKKLSLETQRRKLDLLERYTHARKLAELEAAVRQKEAALDRIQRKAKSNIIQAESSLRARQGEYNRQKERLDKLVEQIAKATITAPMDGQVIYATSVNNRPWDNNEPLKEGVEVWFRRDLIVLPTADTYIANIKISESKLSSVSTGMPVRVRSDALPDHVYEGVLKRISPMVDAGQHWMNPDLNEYPADVLIDGGQGEFKSGMSCRVEILLAAYDDAVSVPVQAVVRIGKSSYVWVRNDRGEPERREVEAGLDNNRVVHITRGLDGTEEVLLNPPLSESVLDREAEAPREKKPDDNPPPPPAN